MAKEDGAVPANPARYFVGFDHAYRLSNAGIPSATSAIFLTVGDW